MKVGLIGLGVMGRNHLRVLQENDSVSSVFVFDQAELQISNQTKVRFVASILEFEQLGLDYAVVALPTRFHLEAASMLANLGIPTLLEKPVAASLFESELIKAAFDSSQTLCAIGHIERFNPALSLLKQKLSEGLVGQPLQISTRRVGPFPHRVGDVGVVRDLASHDIDLVMWLMGQAYRELHTVSSSPRGSAYEDIFLAAGQLDNGVLVSQTVNWLTPSKARETAVLGTEGLLVADSLRAELRFFSNGDQGSEWGQFSNLRGVSEGEELRFVVPVREPLALEHEAMQLEISAPGTTQICSLSEGLEVMRVIRSILGV